MTLVSHKLAHVATSIRRMADLKQLVNDNNQITILGKTYTVTFTGQHYLRATGKNGGQVVISTSPQAMVIENRSCGVYFIAAGTKSQSFTIDEGKTIPLTPVN